MHPLPHRVRSTVSHQGLVQTASSHAKRSAAAYRHTSDSRMAAHQALAATACYHILGLCWRAGSAKLWRWLCRVLHRRIVSVQVCLCRSRKSSLCRLLRLLWLLLLLRRRRLEHHLLLPRSRHVIAIRHRYVHIDRPSSVLQLPFVVLIRLHASTNKEDKVDDYQYSHEGDKRLDELNDDVQGVVVPKICYSIASVVSLPTAIVGNIAQPLIDIPGQRGGRQSDGRSCD